MAAKLAGNVTVKYIWPANHNSLGEIGAPLLNLLRMTTDYSYDNGWQSGVLNNYVIG